jgi:hypothetical protein
VTNQAVRVPPTSRWQLEYRDVPRCLRPSDLWLSDSMPWSSRICPRIRSLRVSVTRRTTAAYLLAEPIRLDKPTGAASTRLRGRGYAAGRVRPRADPCRAPGRGESVPESGINIDAVPGPVTFRNLSLRQFVVTPKGA